MKIRKLFLSLIVAFCMPVAAFAANGCENTDANDYINSSLALCNTHAYNIGMMENPTDSNQRYFMNEVIALKTTIITQQMKQHYDFLDATIKQLKTQMEKAILTAKLEAAGGESAKESSRTSSNNKNTPFASAEDCSAIFSNKDKLACLQRNWTKIYNASNSGNNLDTSMKRQMEIDTGYINGIEINKTSGAISQDCKKSYTNLNKKCLLEMQSKLSNLTAAQEILDRTGLRN
jgi:hypothetical protein